MKLLGSIILRNLCFLQICLQESLTSTLDSLLLYLYHTSGLFILQVGMFHKNRCKKLEKVSIDRAIPNMI